MAAQHQGIFSGRNTSALTASLAVKRGNNTIIYKDILTALADETNGLSMPCNEQRTGAALFYIAYHPHKLHHALEIGSAVIPSPKAEIQL